MDQSGCVRAIGMFSVIMDPFPRMRKLNSGILSDVKGGSSPNSALFVINQIPKPIPLDSQALVKIKAFGLDHVDFIHRKGGIAPEASPILGIEISGTIEELGKGDTCDFKVGDEVFGLVYRGAYAEYITSSTKLLIHKPKELRWELAAAIPATWIMASQALYLVGCLNAGDNVLFHAGTSPVSIACIQLARAAGARSVFITAGSDKMVRFCEQKLGATKGFNYRTTDWVKGIHDATDGYGADIIIDFIGGDNAQKNFETAAKNARIVQLASIGGSIVSNLDIALLETKHLRWEGTQIRSLALEYQAKLRDLFVEKVLPMFMDGTFKAQIDKIFDWRDIQAVQAWMESNTGYGKVICVVE
jgi:NADPH:quinone reductase-like Zn-dependent oxidoreductase